MRIPFGLGLFLALVAGCADVAPTQTIASGEARLTTSAPSDLGARIDALVASYLAAHPAVGVGVAVEQRGQTLLAKGYGLADREAKVPVATDTVFAIGSMSKQFTAAAIFTLIEDGKLTLDDDARTHLPDLGLEHPLRVRNLLHHVSGLHEYLEGVSPDAVFKPIAPSDLVARFKSLPLDFAPGDEWAYSNSGFFVLGLLVEKLSGRSYADYVRERFFEPLGLAHTSYCDPAEKGRAQGYLGQADGTLQRTPDLDMSWAFAAGAICSTPLDVLTWNRALHGGRVVRPESLEVMTHAATLNDGTVTTYGTGLFVDTVNGHRHVEHGGDTLTFTSQLGYYPDECLSIAITANTERSTFDRFGLERAIARLVFGEADPVLDKQPVPAGLDASIAGTYAELGRPNLGSGQVVIGDMGGKPMLGPVALDYTGDRRFVVDLDPQLSMTFAADDASGKAPAFTTYGYEMMFGRARRAASAPMPAARERPMAPLTPFPRRWFAR
jgi:CubicO group peptidase (beta-lactamase class C family)